MRFDKFADRRRELIANQDAEAYARMVNFQGVEPEDSLLYERGLADIEMKKVEDSFYLEQDKTHAYESFKREAVGRMVQIRPLSRDTEKKAKLLTDHFPRQFGEDGKTPVDASRPTSVGRQFENVYEYAQSVR